MTMTEISAVHALDDAMRDLHRWLREGRDAEELLALAIHAHREGRTDVVAEYLDRASEHLRFARMNTTTDGSKP